MSNQVDEMQTAYIEVLQTRIKQLEEALATVRELRVYDRKEIERLRNIGNRHD